MNAINFFKKSAGQAYNSAGSYVYNIPGRIKSGLQNSAASVLRQGISQPLLPRIASLEERATKILSEGQRNALKSLDQSVSELSECAKSGKQLLKTVDSIVKTGADLVGFVAGLYVFNLPGKARKISPLACTVQKVAGFSIAAAASLHWLNRMTKPFVEKQISYIQERILSRLLPKDFSRWN